MSIVVGLRHITRYDYDRPVQLGPHLIRLRPAPQGRARIARYALDVAPEHHVLNWQQDPHGNWLARVVFAEKAKEFSVTVDLVAELDPINPFDFLTEPYATTWPFALPCNVREDAAAFVVPAPAGPLLQDLINETRRQTCDTVSFLVGLNRRLQRTIRYVTRMEPGVQTPEETLAAGAGSCRDTTWLLVQLLRHLGLPARFVSGYLIELAPDATPRDDRSAEKPDRADLHAWAEVYLPGAGWIGLDATSGLLCAEGHLPLAAAPHYRSAAPITGTVAPCEVRFAVEMSVKRFAEQPRVTSC